MMQSKGSKQKNTANAGRNKLDDSAIASRKLNPSRELIESALSQLKVGDVDREELNNLSVVLVHSPVYLDFLKWATLQVIEVDDPYPKLTRLSSVMFVALATGWFAHQSGIGARALQETLAPEN